MRDDKNTAAEPIDDVVIGDDDMAIEFAGDGDKKSIADQILTLISKSDVTLAHDSEARCYLTASVAGHRETHRVGSPGAKRWLRRLAWERLKTGIPGEALRTIEGTLEAKAQFEGELVEVFVRVASTDGAIYLDLGDEQWHVVEITASGWRVISGAQAPVLFRRPPAMLEIPRPERGGDLGELRRFVRAGGDAFALVVAWLVGALAPRGPFSILVLHGEQGSAKSTTARLLRRIIDPSKSDLRAEPREQRDLLIAANNGRVVAIDNVSHIQPWLSDSLCRLSTGAGFSARTLYTDTDETIVEAQRPALLTAIEQVAVRGDLLDRALLVELDAIPEYERRTEDAIEREFQSARPRLLGALLDAVVVALRRRDQIKLERPPRMADFATWICAAEPALPLQPGAFMLAYAESRAGAHETAIDASPFAAALVGLLDELGENTGAAEWTGTADALRKELAGRVAESVSTAKGWPRNAQATAGALKRFSPALRGIGVNIERQRVAGGSRTRTLSITRLSDQGQARPERPARPDVNDSSRLERDEIRDELPDELETRPERPGDRPGASARNQSGRDVRDEGDDPAPTRRDRLASSPKIRPDHADHLGREQVDL